MHVLIISLFYQACQIVGWKEKGHKADCKVLLDKRVRGLFLRRWDAFERLHESVYYPLQSFADLEYDP